jgi:hypothetical protein
VQLSLGPTVRPVPLDHKCLPPPSSVAVYTSGVPRNFVRGGGGVSKNSVEDRGQRERESGGGSPIVKGSAQFGNE